MGLYGKHPRKLGPIVIDENGWRIKTPLLTFHPVSYGVGSLARLSIGLRSEGRRIMFHYFPVDENPQTYHDHPWPFVTLVLWGSYTDLSVDADGTAIERLSRGSVRHRAATHRHKTYVHQPTFTVVLRGATTRQWCEGTTEDWMCDGDPTDFDETLGMRR